MVDHLKYDPDRMVFEDLNISDLTVADAYLNHPVTQALHEDLGRTAGQEPPHIQRVMLQAELVRALDRRDQVLAALDGQPAEAEGRSVLEALVEASNRYIAQIKHKLGELSGSV